MRAPTRRVLVTPLALLLVVVAGCRSTDATAGSGGTGSLPDTTALGVPSTQPAPPTTLVAAEAAYNVYRTFLDTSVAIGSEFDRKPDDGSLDPLTTPEYRMKVIVNLLGLKLNGITQKGQLVTRLLSSSVIDSDKIVLKVCSRDDVDQIDKTGKQLTPPGPGTPQTRTVALIKGGSSWLVDASIGTGEPCDV